MSESHIPPQGVGLPEYYLGGAFKVQKRDRGDTITVCAKTYISNVCQRVEELFNVKLQATKPQWHQMITLKWMTQVCSIMMTSQDIEC